MTRDLNSPYDFGTLTELGQHKVRLIHGCFVAVSPVCNPSLSKIIFGAIQDLLPYNLSNTVSFISGNWYPCCSSLYFALFQSSNFSGMCCSNTLAAADVAQPAITWAGSSQLELNCGLHALENLTRAELTANLSCCGGGGSSKFGWLPLPWHLGWQLAHRVDKKPRWKPSILFHYAYQIWVTKPKPTQVGSHTVYPF